MTTIQQGDLFTLINVFTVTPDKQQPLIDLLEEATEQTMQHLPGFVSANLHRSDDGKYVVNYAQWRGKEDYEAMLRSPEAQPHMKAAAEMAENYNPITCRVAAVIDAEGTPA